MPSRPPFQSMVQAVTVTPTKRSIPQDEVHCRNFVPSPLSKRSRSSKATANATVTQPPLTSFSNNENPSEMPPQSGMNAAVLEPSRAHNQKPNTARHDGRSPTIHIAAKTTRIDKLPRISESERVAREIRRAQELQAYREKYRKAFPTYVFYLDGFDETARNDLIARVEALGGRVDPFFSKDCTHLIPGRSTAAKRDPADRITAQRPDDPSRKLKVKENINPAISALQPLSLNASLGNTDRNPFEPTEKPAKDIAAKAEALGMKVWQKHKFLSILDTLENKSLANTVVQRNDLSHLLHQEKLHGTFERDALTERQDYYYFGKGTFYLLVEDATEVHRPIAIEEHKGPNFDEDPPWPILYNEGEGRCPFSRNDAHARRRLLPTANPHQSLRRSVSLSQMRRSQQLQDLGGGGLRVQMHQDYPLASGNSVQITSNVGSTTSAQLDGLANLGKAGLDPRLAQLARKTLTAPILPTAQRAKSAAEEAAPPTARQTKLAPLRKFLAMRANTRADNLVVNGIRRSASTNDATRALVDKEKKPGYCENCRVKYDDFAEHTVSRKHTKYALEEWGFCEVDDLIHRVQRPLKHRATDP